MESDDCCPESDCCPECEKSFDGPACLNCYRCPKCSPWVTAQYDGEDFKEVMCISCIDSILKNTETAIALDVDDGWFLHIGELREHFNITLKSTDESKNEQIAALEAKVEHLQRMVNFQPGGPGALAAEVSFECGRASLSDVKL